MRSYESNKGTWNWSTAAVRHRFERQRRDVPEVPRHRNGKDTRRWCRGKVGVEHKVQAAEIHSWLTVHRCTVCGKHVEPGRWSPRWLLPRGM